MCGEMTDLRESTSLRRQRGQGMTEYIIIVALIAIGTIATITIFGDNIRALFGASANALVGQNDQSVTDLGGKQVEAGQVNKNLSDFNKPDP
jgi:pilus assembly protein Flp/PilA